MHNCHTTTRCPTGTKPINYRMQWHKGKKRRLCTSVVAAVCPIFDSCCWRNCVHNSAGLKQTFKKTILIYLPQRPNGGYPKGKYPFILLSLTTIHSFFFFLLRTFAICVCGVSGIVAVNNPSAYNKSLRRAIDVTLQGSPRAL